MGHRGAVRAGSHERLEWPQLGKQDPAQGERISCTHSSRTAPEHVMGHSTDKLSLRQTFLPQRCLESSVSEVTFLIILYKELYMLLMLNCLIFKEKGCSLHSDM